MNKILLTFLLAPFLFAKIISGVAVTVDDEIITLYEIQKEQSLSKQDVSKTVDTLIRMKLEQAEAKKRDIVISNTEVLEDLKNIAQQNNMNLSQLYEAINSSRGLTESQIKDKTRERLLKKKLFNAIAMSQMDEPTDEEIQEYYNLHQNEYTTPKYINTLVYSSNDKQALSQKMSNPMMHLPQVISQETKFELAKINPRLAELLIKTKDYTFSPILPQGENAGYMAIYVQEKLDISTPSLDLIRPQVQKKIMEINREHILNDHFQRIRIKANIKIIRLPQE